MQTDTELSALQRAKQLASRIFGTRPIWMNILMVFCAYMTFFYLPWDLFVKPVAQDQEVWFGILLTGWAAKATEPLHWAIYAAGTWGFWKMRSWMWPWASLYVLQIAISMFVWQFRDPRGDGILGGVLIAAPFLLLTVALWRTRWRFDAETERSPQDPQEPSGETTEIVEED
jgi:hypothetical protein